MSNANLNVEPTHVRRFMCGVCKTPVYYSREAKLLWCKCRPTETALSIDLLERTFEPVKTSKELKERSEPPMCPRDQLGRTWTHRALSSRVLTVAIERTLPSGARIWRAFIDAVPGQDHDKEAEQVARRGSSLPQNIASLIYPDFAKVAQWRD